MLPNESYSLLDNSTDIAAGYIPYAERLETYLVPALFTVIFLAGFVGNGTLVLIMMRHRAMRNVPNTYILSLALGDLLVIVAAVPFTSTLYTIESWPYGASICKLSEATKDVSIGVSVFTLTALSAERYCAIVHPIRRHISTKPMTIVTTMAIWILSCLLALPAAIFSHVQKGPIGPNITIDFCSPFPPEFGVSYQQSIILFRFLAYYACPLCIIAAFYILMARHLVLSTKNIPGERAHLQSTQIRARKKVAKMVLAFVIIFIICFLPIHVFSLWFHFHPGSQDLYNEFWHCFRIVGFCLSFINSCINPIALYFVSKAFRKHYNRYLFCWCTRRRRREDLALTHVSSSRRSVRQETLITSGYMVTHTEKT